ncbi:ATP-grasp fold amidoligase family protein [uncultured Sphingomonas sp.]|uniref:ATP-grasp fold amidoligase family protein n=1 Tax=uncultured Sphingomonas sp. TaxID=158754 RepID=UPI0035CC863B
MSTRPLGAARPLSGPIDPARALERLRVRLCYIWRHGRLPDLADPVLFTELIQHRKLHDRDLRMPSFADKVRAKTLVADLLEPAWVTPKLWSGTALPEEAPWPRPFVVKSRHGCNQVRVVRASDDWAAVRDEAFLWMRRPYGIWLDEWLYRRIPLGLLVEAFAGPGPDLPVDYKFFPFGGRVEYIQVHLDRGGDHRWIVMDRDWTRVSAATPDPDPPRPAALPRMIAAAETLSVGFDFVRVDLYDLPAGPRFGEMTFYPGSGLDRFDPPALDAVMGARWLRARTLTF